MGRVARIRRISSPLAEASDFFAQTGHFSLGRPTSFGLDLAGASFAPANPRRTLRTLLRSQQPLAVVQANEYQLARLDAEP